MIIWSPRAMAELEAEAAWIAKERPRAAEQIIERIRSATLVLADHPLAGKPLREYPRHGARELVVAPYRVIYVPTGEDVQVVTVKHSREKLRKKDLRPDLT
jgi:toxin ParE1/3/4